MTIERVRKSNVYVQAMESAAGATTFSKGVGLCHLLSIIQCPLSLF
jgi:hypothetical protein